MKSLPLLNPSRGRARHDARRESTAPQLPQTNFHFQPATEELATTGQPSPVVADAEELHAFRQIGTDGLGSKRRRGFFVEVAAFVIVTGLSVWALISLLILLMQTANG
jgi:Flp pilus assembly protein TadB